MWKSREDGPFRASLPFSIDSESTDAIKREVIAKTSQQVLKLRWPDGDLLSHRDVDAFADEEIKRIVTRGLAVRRRPTLVMALLATGRAFSCVTMLCNAR